MNLFVIDLGLISFKGAFSKQIQIHNQVLSGSLPHTLILCEHPHTITISRQAQVKNILDYGFIKQNDVDFIVGLNRGGDVTYHGPGQLMGYLIFDLRRLNRNLSLFLENAEKAVVGVINSFGIRANVKAGFRGAWVGQKKMASIGIGVDKWVTLHGFGLNVNTNLDFFDIIRPCGMDVEMTSMEKELGFCVSMQEVKRRIVKEICLVFGLTSEAQIVSTTKSACICV